MALRTDEAAPDAHQFAKQGKVVDLLGQLARGEQPLRIGGEPRQIGDPAEFPERVVGLEIGLERHRGRDAVALDQRHRLLENAAVERFEEMVGGQRDGQVLDDTVVDQERTQKRGLGLDIARQLAFIPGRSRGRNEGEFRHGHPHASMPEAAQPTS